MMETRVLSIVKFFLEWHKYCPPGNFRPRFARELLVHLCCFTVSPFICLSQPYHVLDCHAFVCLGFTVQRGKLFAFEVGDFVPARGLAFHALWSHPWHCHAAMFARASNYGFACKIHFLHLQVSCMQQLLYEDLGEPETLRPYASIDCRNQNQSHAHSCQHSVC